MKNEVIEPDFETEITNDRSDEDVWQLDSGSDDNTISASESGQDSVSYDHTEETKKTPEQQIENLLQMNARQRNRRQKNRRQRRVRRRS